MIYDLGLAIAVVAIVFLPCLIPSLLRKKPSVPPMSAEDRAALDAPDNGWGRK